MKESDRPPQTSGSVMSFSSAHSYPASWPEQERSRYWHTTVVDRKNASIGVSDTPGWSNEMEESRFQRASGGGCLKVYQCRPPATPCRRDTFAQPCRSSQFERYLYEFPLSNNLASFAVTISKLKRDVISIRDLLAIGQDMTARVLARTFIEDIEIAMVLALSEEMCIAFATTHDTNEFWNKHIGYGKVYENVHQYLLACGTKEERSKSLVERHREAKKMFSESTHGGRQPSLTSAFAPSLTDKEEVHFFSLGALTYASAQLALFVAQETHAFAGSIVKGTMVDDPMHLFRDFSNTGRHMNAVGSAYVLQELLARYESEMEEHQARFA